MVTFDTREVLFGCDHLGRITMMPVASCIPFPFFASCDDMLSMLVYATCWLYMHFYTLAYMSMHESCLLVCRLCFNIMKLWTFDLHLSPVDTTFCVFVFFLVCLLPFLFFCLSCGLSCLLPYAIFAMPIMPIMLICFMPLSYALCFFSFNFLSVGFLSLPLHVHTWSEDAWS